MQRKASLRSEELPVKTTAVAAADPSRSALAVAPLAQRGDLDPAAKSANEAASLGSHA